MTLLIEALSGVLDTFLLYLFASGFYSKYRSTKYKGHLYLLVGIFIIVMSCIPMPGKLRINIPFHYMNVNRPVVIGVEHKSKAKEVKYGRHPLIFISKTNIGNIFITCKKRG